jgi:hypothetical protein
MPPSSATPRHALRGLVCLVLLGWAGKPASARIRAYVQSVPDDSSPPYLRAIGSLPLRFQPAPAPRAPIARPAASGPPLPVASAPASTAPTPPLTGPDSSPATPPAETAPESTRPTPPAPVPPAIIPDEMRPRVQPEDFLPFFQFPGSTGASGDVQVIAPLNAAPNPPRHGTPSTATYRQQ